MGHKCHNGPLCVPYLQDKNAASQIYQVCGLEEKGVKRITIKLTCLIFHLSCFWSISRVEQGTLQFQ